MKRRVAAASAVVAGGTRTCGWPARLAMGRYSKGKQTGLYGGKTTDIGRA